MLLLLHLAASRSNPETAADHGRLPLAGTTARGAAASARTFQGRTGELSARL